MVDDEFWRTVQEKEMGYHPSPKTGALNLALLFGTAAIALTLVLTPMLSSKTDSRLIANSPVDYDSIQTGSIVRDVNVKVKKTDRYTVRDTAVQPVPGAVCIIDGNGAKSGC